MSLNFLSLFINLIQSTASPGAYLVGIFGEGRQVRHITNLYSTGYENTLVPELSGLGRCGRVVYAFPALSRKISIPVRGFVTGARFESDAISGGEIFVDALEKDGVAALYLHSTLFQPLVRRDEVISDDGAALNFGGF